MSSRGKTSVFLAPGPALGDVHDVPGQEGCSALAQDHRSLLRAVCSAVVRNCLPSPHRAAFRAGALYLSPIYDQAAENP